MSGRRGEDHRAAPPGGSSRRVRFPGSDSGFESLDGEQYYRGQPANPVSPPFTDADAARQWNSLPLLQKAYRDLWDKQSQLVDENKSLRKDNEKLKDDKHRMDALLKKIEKEKDVLNKENDSLAAHHEGLRAENLALKDAGVRYQSEIARLSALHQAQRSELDALRPPSSESSSSRTKTSSSSHKKDKSRDKEKDRDRGERREKERSREPPVDPETERLRGRFDNRGPPPTQSLPVRSRRGSVSSHHSRPSVMVPAPGYEAAVNYQTSTPIGGAAPAYGPSVPRAYPTGTPVTPFSPTYATHRVPDGNYHPTPLSREGR